MPSINRNYIFIFLLLLIIEFAIAYFHFNWFIRGFVGDVLVIPLLYSFFKIFIKNNVTKTAISVLLFSFFVEILQYFKIAELLKIQSKVILTLIGSVFDVWDLVAYSIGFLILLLAERYFHKNTLQ